MKGLLLVDLFLVFIVVYLYCYVVFVFFFKQKTAYEMRISDWSSDVCSSDLSAIRPKNAIAVSEKLGKARLIGIRPATSQAPQNSATEATRHHSMLQIGRASCRERVCQYV